MVLVIVLSVISAFIGYINRKFGPKTFWFVLFYLLGLYVLLAAVGGSSEYYWQILQSPTVEIPVLAYLATATIREAKRREEKYEEYDPLEGHLSWFYLYMYQAIAVMISLLWALIMLSLAWWQIILIFITAATGLILNGLYMHEERKKHTIVSVIITAVVAFAAVSFLLFVNQAT